MGSDIPKRGLWEMKFRVSYLTNIFLSFFFKSDIPNFNLKKAIIVSIFKPEIQIFQNSICNCFVEKTMLVLDY